MGRELEGKVALVTGSSRGIGRSCALALAEQGADVVVNYRTRSDAAAEVAKEIEGIGGTVEVVGVDVGTVEGARLLVERSLERFDRIDVLVNNAGIWRFGKLTEIDFDELDRLMDVNVKSVFYVTGSALEYMRQSGGGRIINMSSVLGVTGFQGDTMYSASKAAIIGFTKALAKEVARDDITVNAVIPGFIETDMAEEADPTVRERLLRQIPMRRWGRPEEVADLVVFLAARGSYITGHLFTVDGGFSI